MDGLTKTLVVTENYISGSLVSLKLKSMGFKVTLSHALQEALDLLNDGGFNLFVVEDCLSLEKLTVLIKESNKALVFLEKNGVKERRNSINVAFNENEFLHLVSFATEPTPTPQKNETSLVESVILHYGGDEKLAYQVCQAFVVECQLGIDNIKDAFEKDNDAVLARKLHSFKGVLSTLGKTSASQCIIKMEILVKGQLRSVALELMDQLFTECAVINEDLSECL
jgi:hypothetical protein